MAKFETEKTLLYKYLIAELKDDLFYAEQRVDIMKGDSDFGTEIKFEYREIKRIKEKIDTLEGYLQESVNTHVNHPVVVEMSYINKFKQKKRHIHLESNQLDDEPYYLKESGILFQDWMKLDEGKIYIVGNLSLQRQGDILLSKYPQESMWHLLGEDILWMLYDKMIYIVEGECDKEGHDWSYYEVSTGYWGSDIEQAGMCKRCGYDTHAQLKEEA